VYSETTLPPLPQIGRHSKAIGFAWLVVAVLISFVNPDASNRIVVLLMLVINYILLVSYRVVLMNVTNHGALDIRHVAVVGNTSSAHDFARTINRHDVWGLKLMGVFSHDEIRALLEG
jgi:FlaA1/EpsC-like NDP-sugar epimerase